MKIPIKTVDTSQFDQGTKDPKATVTDIWLRFKKSLASFRQQKQPTHPSNVPCGTCTACCRNFGRVEFSPGDDPSLEHYTHDDGKEYLPQTKEGHCIYLGESGCTVYEIRPTTCRFFDCRLYHIAGIVYANPEQESINTAIQSWDTEKLYKTPEDAARGIATRMMYTHLRQRFPQIMDNPIPAFAGHERFMIAAFAHLQKHGMK